MTRKKISKQLTTGLFIGIFTIVTLAILINANQFKKSTNPNSKDLVPLTVQSFNKIHIDGSISVHFANSNEPLVRVNDRLIKNGSLILSNENSTLMIKSTIIKSKKLNTPSVIVYTNHLTELILTNNAQVTFKDYTGDSLSAEANHSKLTIKNLTLNYFSLALDDDAHLSGEPLSADILDINIDNKSSIWTGSLVVEQITGKINNGSWISYQGNSPTMNLQVDHHSKINKY